MGYKQQFPKHHLFLPTLVKDASCKTLNAHCAILLHFQSHSKMNNSSINGGWGPSTYVSLWCGEKIEYILNFYIPEKSDYEKESCAYLPIKA